MAKKKSAGKSRKKKTSKVSKASSSRRAGMSSRGPRDLKIADPPSSDDPKAQAEYFVDMLDAFAQQGTPEAKRIRQGLIKAIDDYGAAEDKEAAAELTRMRLLGLEAGVSELLLRSTRKMRDRLGTESRKLGTSSKIGKSVRAGADGLSLMVSALENMLAAAESGDQALRDQAHVQLAEARSMMEGASP